MGLFEKINASGARVLADVGAADGSHIFLREQGVSVIAINSARRSYHARHPRGMDT
jgi:hypothetical protein